MFTDHHFILQHILSIYHLTSPHPATGQTVDLTLTDMILKSDR